ncbi:MAG: hypothetical protein LBJ72_12000 [Dysgonamonadaceae bacterium]|jgi:hypothetical protein|nr:hypothetical protein [Dysgonamonadaceae bacterium]
MKFQEKQLNKIERTGKIGDIDVFVQFETEEKKAPRAIQMNFKKGNQTANINYNIETKFFTMNSNQGELAFIDEVVKIATEQIVLTLKEFEG